MTIHHISRPRSRRPGSRFRGRVPVALVATVATLGLGAALAPAAASAHVTATSPGLAQGGYGVITFNVPNETDTNTTTTSLTITLPNLKSARPEAIPGWQAAVTKDPTTDEATSVTWTTTPGATGVAPGQFQRFVLSAGPLPEKESVTFPAVQTYSDGERVDWNQAPNADGSEPEHPAPEIELAAKSDDHHGSGTAAGAEECSDTDTTARWLGGAGLVVGVIGLAAAGVAFRRRA
ncbi:YcnI family protein [Williamsia herbipolensis]|uniref:YcnI family protein n=1 Tax=Williamsia herbipolensis TaxID=1603258 RepID=UPI0009E1EFC3|nr:YcnI family protein [Williamsia herbipolensis]